MLGTKKGKGPTLVVFCTSKVVPLKTHTLVGRGVTARGEEVKLLGNCDSGSISTYAQKPTQVGV